MAEHGPLWLTCGKKGLCRTTWIIILGVGWYSVAELGGFETHGMLRLFIVGFQGLPLRGFFGNAELKSFPIFIFMDKFRVWFLRP